MPFRVCNQLSESFESEKSIVLAYFISPSSVPPSLESRHHEHQNQKEDKGPKQWLGWAHNASVWSFSFKGPHVATWKPFHFECSNIGYFLANSDQMSEICPLGKWRLFQLYLWDMTPFTMTRSSEKKRSIRIMRATRTKRILGAFDLSSPWRSHLKVPKVAVFVSQK